MSLTDFKEFIRPVLITKWALAALVIIIGNYTTLETTVRRPNTKPASTSSIHSAASPSLSSNQSSEATNSSIESPQGFILEIVMNCTHVIYQLSRANILSQKELFTDGVLPSLLMLVSFNMQNLKLESFVIEGSPTITPTTDENDQSFVDNITIIQTLAAKSISSISSLVPFKEKIIQSIQSTSTMPSLLRSTNEDVQKYAAKTIAYLSLRNGKHILTNCYIWISYLSLDFNRSVQASSSCRRRSTCITIDSSETPSKSRHKNWWGIEIQRSCLLLFKEYWRYNKWTQEPS